MQWIEKSEAWKRTKSFKNSTILIWFQSMPTCEIVLPGVQCIPQKCVQCGIWCRGILRPLLSCPHLPLLLTLELIIATTSLIIIIVFYICFPLSTSALARAVMIKKSNFMSMNARLN